MGSKKPSEHYIALGLTAFCVIAASILFFFLLYHFAAVRTLAASLMLILRPILYGLVLAFLLLPVHRHILTFLIALIPSQRVRPLLNGAAILLSLFFALLIIYIFYSTFHNTCSIFMYYYKWNVTITSQIIHILT